MSGFPSRIDAEASSSEQEIRRLLLSKTHLASPVSTSEYILEGGQNQPSFGALLFIPAEFHLSTFQVETVVTVVVVGSIVGVLLGGPIANTIGRKPIMIVVAFSYF